MKLKLLFLTALITSFSFSQIRLVKDVNPNGSSNPQEPFINGNTLYFSAEGDTTGRELWKTDGTEAGTNLVQDFIPNNGDTTPSRYSSLNVNEFIFVGFGLGVGKELLKTDGNTITVLEDFHSGGSNGDPNWFAESDVDGSKIFFAANRNGANSIGVEIFSIDKTTEVINQVTDINTNGHSFPAELFNYQTNNVLLFRATNTSGDRELYRYDGSNTSLVKNINVSGNDSAPQYFFEYNGEVYFKANDGVNGNELWKTDGTDSGTVLLKDINPSGNSTPLDFISYNGLLYFSADDGNGRELWRTDGTQSGTIKILVNPSQGSEPNNFTIVDNKLFFSAVAAFGRELYYMDTTETAVLAGDIYQGALGSSPAFFIEYNNNLYFQALNNVVGEELYRYNTTSQTIELVDNLASGLASASPIPLVVFNNDLYFSASDNISIGRELYAYRDVTLSTEEVTLKNEISLYPNPTTDSFHIKTNEMILGVSIYDITGKLVNKFDDKQNEYDISHITNGVYFAKVSTENSQETIKILKK